MIKEKNDIVAYRNELNRIALKTLTLAQRNILMALLLKLRNKEDEEVSLSAAELKILSNFQSNSNSLFVKELDTITDALAECVYKRETEDKIVKFTMFSKLEVIKDKRPKINVKMNPDFMFIINDVFQKGNFTFFELAEHTQLKSKYSQTLYRLLKQFRTSGFLRIKYEDFLEQFDVPESYNSGAVKQKVVDVAIKELNKLGFFKNLECQWNRDGWKILSLHFTFEKESIKSIHDVERSFLALDDFKRFLFNEIDNGDVVMPFAVFEEKVMFISYVNGQKRIVSEDESEDVDKKLERMMNMINVYRHNCVDLLSFDERPDYQDNNVFDIFVEKLMKKMVFKLRRLEK